jgi:cytochrome P450
MKIPHVKGRLPWLGSSLAFGADPDAFVRRHQAQLGDVFSVVLNGQKSTFFLNALDFAEVFRNAKTLSGEHALPEIGGKMFGYDAEAYKAVQHDFERITSKTMQGQALEPLTRRMQLELEKVLVERSIDADRIGLTQLMLDTLFPASTRSLFGDDVHSEDTIRHFLNFDKPLPFILGSIPALFFPAFRKARKTLTRLMTSPHENQSEVMDAHHDLWKRRAVSPSVHGAVDFSVLWAAQANTIPSAVWTLYYVMRDSEIRRIIVDEVRRVSQTASERSSHGMPLLDPSHLAEMKVLDSCIWEAMRLTTATTILRDALAPTTLSLHNGQAIELAQGDRLLLYTRAVHLDPDIYESPSEFKHDRFLGRTSPFMKSGTPVRFHLLPFGGGKSICPGRHFAVNEFKLLIALLVAAFEFELVEASEPELDFSRVGLGSMPPKNDIIAKVRFRGFAGLSG